MHAKFSKVGGPTNPLPVTLQSAALTPARIRYGISRLINGRSVRIFENGVEPYACGFAALNDS